MTFRFSAVCLALCALSANAFAEKMPFTGLSVGADLAYQDSSVSVNFAGDGPRQTSTGIHFSGNHGTKLTSGSDGAIFLAGLEYAPTPIKSGAIGSGTSKLTNAYSYFVGLGWLIDNQTMPYVKISNEWSTLTSTASNGSTTSHNVTGFGLGLGVRTVLNPSTYLQAEIRQAKYDTAIVDLDIAKPKTTLGTIGIGYNF